MYEPTACTGQNPRYWSGPVRELSPKIIRQMGLGSGGRIGGTWRKWKNPGPNAACFPRSSWSLFEDLTRSSYGMDVDEHDGAVGFLISDPVDSFYVAQYLNF